MAATDLQLEGIEEGIGQTDRQWVERARARASRLVMPTRALGRLREISEKLGEICKTLEPSIDRKTILVLAADHGVLDEGVSAYPH